MSKAIPTLTASVQAKNGHLYAVIPYKVNGKRKTAWRSIGLDEGAPKNKVSRAFSDAVNKFQEEYAKEVLNHNADSDINVYDFLVSYLEKSRSRLQITTFEGYSALVHTRIKEYFGAHRNITVGSLSSSDIDDFYNFLRNKYELSTGTIRHYHQLMHAAFHQAYINDSILKNPFDKVKKPGTSDFVGSHYSEEELQQLLNVTRNEPIYPAIVMAGCMGLRRSECVGVRWSRINMENREMFLDTKVIDVTEDNKRKTVAIEKMKNESSRRTLSIPDPVYEMLLAQKKKIEMYKEIFKSDYNTEFDDYVCVDQLGNRISPDYITQRFVSLLEKHGLRKIRFHDLRHTFASILINKDMPLINISQFLGHSTVTTTSNIYTHLNKNKKKETADMISELIS